MELDMNQDEKEQLQERLKEVEQIALNIFNEKQLKDKVVKKESDLINLRKKLDTLKKELLRKQENHLASISESETNVHVTGFEHHCIESVEKRVEHLQERRLRIEEELNLAEERRRFSGKNKSAFMETISEILYENGTMERYIRSESFRVFDDKIALNSKILNDLSQELSRLKDKRVYLEQLEVERKSILASLQKKYQSRK